MSADYADYADAVFQEEADAFFEEEKEISVNGARCGHPFSA
jgi:hypothetical protein